ncbi:MAG: hypothetical protein HND47_20280 [Chloroflexi bacterium]|nr:hypothetical protein [Chloroflexota bacterium]
MDGRPLAAARRRSNIPWSYPAVMPPSHIGSSGLRITGMLDIRASAIE